MKIKSITPCGRETVYNMTVDVHHNYLISGGIILKNCDALRYLAQLRTMAPELAGGDDEDDWEDGDESSYESFMCGGEPGRGYLAG